MGPGAWPQVRWAHAPRWPVRAHIPRLVSPLHSAAAADLRNRCRDRCTGGVECSPAGHISPALEANAADIHTAYRWGPSQSHMATANPDAPLPIFLAFQPYVRSTPCPCACQDAPTALVRAGGVGGGAALAEGLHLGVRHGAGLAPDHRLPRVLRLYIRLKRRRSDDLKCLRALGGNLVPVNGVAATCICMFQPFGGMPLPHPFPPLQPVHRPSSFHGFTPFAPAFCLRTVSRNAEGF